MKGRDWRVSLGGAAPGIGGAGTATPPAVAGPARSAVPLRREMQQPMDQTGKGDGVGPSLANSVNR